MSTPAPIETCIANWHLYMRGELPGGLDAILHEDCTFLSPIVFTPQQGREITKLYLTAAAGTLGGNDGDGADGDDIDGDDNDSDSTAGSFRYAKEILQGNHAMLEFETTVEGKYANGVDIITCDDHGMITEFKVMMRPLQAINAVHAQMKAMLERLSS
jgi:hypothetical protein